VNDHPSRSPAPTPPALTPAAPASAGPTRDERWIGDVDALVEAIRRLHPDPFHDVPRARFLAAAARLEDRVPVSTDAEVLVGLMRLAALPSARGRDGHLGLWPPDSPTAIRRFPVRLWSFPDGLHVTAALDGAPGLVGARVLRVNGAPVPEVLRRLDPVVPHDTPSNLRAARLVYLTSAEVLQGLHLADDPDTLTLDVRTTRGERRTLTIPAIDADAYAVWVDGWELLPPWRPGLGFLASTAWSARYLPGDRAVLVRYAIVREGSGAIARRINALERRHPVDRIVLDLRANGGGEAAGYRALLEALARTEIPLRVLIGRLTFSAAATFVTAIERRIPGVVLLGEAMGGATSFWANPTAVTLPNSGLVVLVPTSPFGAPLRDRGPYEVLPDLPTPFTAADYLAGRDPVLARALRDP
jgi:hypothetical protein